MTHWLNAWQAGVLATTDDFKIVILVVGVAVLISGLLLVFYHRNTFNTEHSQGLPGDAKFERRKHGRRMAVGRLIVCLGLVMASCYWVHERFAFAILLGMMLLLIVCITILAYVDMASVGLKLSLDRMAENEREVDRAVQEAIADHLRNQGSGEPDDADEPPSERN